MEMRTKIKVFYWRRTCLHKMWFYFGSENWVFLYLFSNVIMTRIWPRIYFTYFILQLKIYRNSFRWWEVNHTYAKGDYLRCFPHTKWCNRQRGTILSRESDCESVSWLFYANGCHTVPLNYNMKWDEKVMYQMNLSNGLDIFLSTQPVITKLSSRKMLIRVEVKVNLVDSF